MRAKRQPPLRLRCARRSPTSIAPDMTCSARNRRLCSSPPQPPRGNQAAGVLRMKQPSSNHSNHTFRWRLAQRTTGPRPSITLILLKIFDKGFVPRFSITVVSIPLLYKSANFASGEPLADCFFWALFLIAFSNCWLVLPSMMFRDEEAFFEVSNHVLLTYK